jgi:hypothetical protein
VWLFNPGSVYIVSSSIKNVGHFSTGHHPRRLTWIQPLR